MWLVRGRPVVLFRGVRYRLLKEGLKTGLLFGAWWARGWRYNLCVCVLTGAGRRIGAADVVW